MKYNEIINEIFGKIVFAEQLKIAYRLDSSKRWNNVENLTLYLIK